MKWLEAMLAFALTMVVFSTMVTVSMEILYRFARAREKIFKQMLERMFSQVLWPLVQQRLASAKVEDIQANFVSALTRNSVADEVPRVAKVPLRRVDNSKMTVLEFAERLAGTDVGKAIAAEGKERVVAIVNDLAQKFDRFTANSRTLLTDRSLSVSLVASIVLAFWLNIDAVTLFRSFVQDEKIRQQVIERYDGIAKEMAAADESLRKVKSAAAAQADGNVKVIEERLQHLQGQFNDLSAIGLPIGYENFPGCLKPGVRTTVGAGNCVMPKEVDGFLGAMVHNATERTAQFMFWFVSVLLGGFLIGLGAPFWFDFAQGLSKSLQVLKAIGGGREKEREEAAPAAAAGVSPPPRNPVEAFTTAIAALPDPELRKVPG